MEMKHRESVVCSCECDGHTEKESKQKTSPVTVVLKVGMHCDGCIARIVGLARRFEGVEAVRVDAVSNKLTLVGFMDPVKVAEKMQKKSKKHVELLSPKPKKANKENTDPKAQKTMVAVTTVVLKLSCACDGCIKRIRKTVFKTKGVNSVKIDKQKEVVTVTGTMDIKSVTENLKRKLNKTVEVLPEKKKKKNKEDNEEGITNVGFPGLPGCSFNHGHGPCCFVEHPIGEFFSEEHNFCCVM